MTKQTLGVAAAAAVLAFFAAAQAAAQDAVTPEYKWTKGGTAHYRLDVKKISTVTGAQEAEIDQTWFYLFDAEIADVAPDGTATVRVKFDKSGVRFQIPAKSMDFTYDPGNPEDEKRAGSPLSAPFVAIVGETIVYKVAKNGKLIAVEGLSEMFQRIGEKVKAAPQGANYYAIAMSALDDMRTAQMETMFRRLPEKPLKPGDSYKTPKVREIHPAVGNLLVQADCSFRGAEPAGAGEAWKIACEISKVPEAAGGGTAPGKLADAKATSEFLLAKDTGAMVKNSYASVMAVEQSLPAEPGAAPDTPPATITERSEITATLELQTGAPTAAAPAAAPPSGS